MIFGVSLFCPPFKYFLRNFVLPAPGTHTHTLTFLSSFTFLFFFLRVVSLSFLTPHAGSGPSESDMDEGFLKVNAFGVGDRGTKAKVMASNNRFLSVGFY
jgi:hypothetical protein